VTRHPVVVNARNGAFDLIDDADNRRRRYTKGIYQLTCSTSMTLPLIHVGLQRSKPSHGAMFGESCKGEQLTGPLL